jgi:formyl-CoA transferase
VIEIDEPVFGPMLRHGAPAVFSETPARLAPGCWAGQHTQSVLAEFGYSEAEIQRLDQLGITRSTRPTALT